MHEYPLISPCAVDLNWLIFSAKIDYITVHTPRKVKLPALSGKAIWPRQHHGQRLTVHDASANDIALLVKTVGAARIVEIEIAIDLRPRLSVPAADREGLLRAVMVDIFARGLEPSGGLGVSRDFRAFYRRIDGGYIVRPFNKGLPRSTDQQLHGGRGDPVQVKGYWKRRDNGDQLPVAEQVARVEVRLGSAVLVELGLVSLTELQGFKFRTKLMPYFRHVRGTRRSIRKATEESMGMQRLLASKLDEIDRAHWGFAGVGAFLSGGKRERSAVRLLRDTPVNNRIGQALTRLEQQFVKMKFVRSEQKNMNENSILTRLCAGSGQSFMTI